MDLSTIPIADLIAEIRRRNPISASSAASNASEIIARVSAETGIDPAYILSRCLTRRVTKARMRCMAETYRRGFSSTEVGDAFGRDHSTVLHALKKIAA